MNKNHQCNFIIDKFEYVAEKAGKADTKNELKRISEVVAEYNKTIVDLDKIIEKEAEPEIKNELKRISEEIAEPKKVIVDLDKIAETADGLSGADVSSIANTAVSLVIHEFLNKYPDQKEAEKQAATAKITMERFEEAVRKVRTQKDLKIGEKVAVPYYR